MTIRPVTPHTYHSRGQGETSDSSPIGWNPVRALRSFTVRPVLPTPLTPLLQLAMTPRWSRDERTRDVFPWVDPDVWGVPAHDPAGRLGLVSNERLESL